MNSEIQKIMVIGCCGAGKSTLCFQLAEHFKLPLFHLDKLYWKSGWIESEREEWVTKHQQIIDQDRWIIDGNYSSTLPERLEKADMVIYMDFPRLKCLWGILKRWIMYKGSTRPDMNEGCEERLDWEFTKYVWNFQRDVSPHLVKQITKLEGTKPVHLLTSRKEAENLLLELIQEKAT